MVFWFFSHFKSILVILGHSKSLKVILSYSKSLFVCKSRTRLIGVGLVEQDGTYGHPLIIESLVQGLKRERATERERDRKTDTLTQQRREREKRERIDLFMILKHSPGGA